MRQSIGKMALVVRDYDEAIAFYVGTLGFTLVEDTYIEAQNKRWVVVAPPGSSGSQLLLARAVGEEQSSRIGNQTGGRVFMFLHTNDFWRDFRAYKAKGVVFVREPTEESYGTVAVFKDLYGNLWDLVQRKESIPSHQESDTMHDQELAGILDDLRKGFNGDAWHGPPLCKVLDGVTAELASARPIPGSHSIWEIVAHLTAWDKVVGKRISERRPI